MKSNRCKVTVMKKLYHDDLAEEYCLNETKACELFDIGQEYTVEFPMKEPEGFPCSGAWVDISGLVLVLMQGGGFGPKTWKWMKNDHTMITCCSDGVRPVIFKLELIEKS